MSERELYANPLPPNTLTNADGTPYAAGHDTTREAFEKAIAVDGLHVNLMRIGPASSNAGDYADVIVQTCWRVWQLALIYARELE